MGAASHAQPADFHDAPRDERRFGIVAEAKPVTDADRDGNDIFNAASSTPNRSALV